MALKLITAAAGLAISVAEAKAHLRVDVTDEDALIELYIKAATEAAEQATGRAIMAQTWELTQDAFASVLHLTRIPVASVTSLKYIDADGTQQTLGTMLYQLDNFDDFSAAKVTPAYGASWPSTRPVPNAVAVRYVAGYGSAADVPSSIKDWIYLQVGAMFENRALEGGVQTFALGYADRLLDRWKVY